MYVYFQMNNPIIYNNKFTENYFLEGFSDYYINTFLMEGPFVDQGGWDILSSLK